MSRLPKDLPEKDQALEDLNRDLFGIIYRLNELFPSEAGLALMKLRSASEDIHRIRIDQVTPKLSITREDEE